VTGWRDRCRDVEPLLADAVDGGIPAADRARLDAHLAGCARCRQELEAASVMAGELRSLPREELPPFFTSRLLARLDEPDRGLQPAHRPSPHRSLWFAWGSAAVLAIALVVTLVGRHAAWTPVRPHESSTPSLSQAQAHEAHENDVRMATLRAGIQPVSPLDDAVVSANDVAICAALAPSLPKASFRLLVDGRDVTALADITHDYIIFEPDDGEFGDGPHLVSVELDTGRDRIEKSWIFYAMDGKGRRALPETREKHPASAAKPVPPSM